MRTHYSNTALTINIQWTSNTAHCKRIYLIFNLFFLQKAWRHKGPRHRSLRVAPSYDDDGRFRMNFNHLPPMVSSVVLSASPPAPPLCWKLNAFVCLAAQENHLDITCYKNYQWVIKDATRGFSCLSFIIICNVWPLSGASSYLLKNSHDVTFITGKINTIQLLNTILVLLFPL